MTALLTRDLGFLELITLLHVILTIPYSSNATTLEDVTTYELDSLYGSSPIKLSVFKNDFLLRKYDPSACPFIASPNASLRHY